MISPFASIRVGPVDYEIRWYGNAEEGAFGYRGLVNHNLAIVWFNGEAPPTQMAVTFLHEVMHAVQTNGHLADEHKCEDCTEIASTGLTAFWRDNPEVMRWWMGLIMPGKGFTD